MKTRKVPSASMHCNIVVKEIDEQLKKTRDYKDITELRTYYDSGYKGFGMPYPFSYANEVVTKGIKLLKWLTVIRKMQY